MVGAVTLMLMQAIIPSAYSTEELLLKGPHYFAEIRFVQPSWSQIEHLDIWLTQVLRMHMPSFDGSDAKDARASAGAFVGQLVHVCQQLLVLGRVPCFDVPKVLSWSEVPSEQGAVQQVKLGFDVPDHMPWGNYLHVLNTALSMLLDLSRQPMTLETIRALHERLEQQVLRPLHQATATGKSTMPVLAQAHARGIPWIHLGAGVYQLGWGSRARRLDRSSIDLDSAMGARLVQNKVTCAALLRMAGLPAPVHEVVTDEAQALRAAHQIGYPVVIKPTDCDRGEGITVDVADDAALTQAFQHALSRAQNKQVIVERQVEGVCHRVFVAHGEVLYAVKRLPMSVEGNGAHTVRELVDAQWQHQQALPPWQRSGLQPLDDLALRELARSGWAPESVPGAGVRVPLRRIESTEWGGVDEEVTLSMHPDNRAIAIQAARLSGLAVAGVDIITPDVGRPWHANGAIINEVNYAPLLGGGDISRSHIPAYLHALMPTDGRIPVDMFEGTQAEDKACLQQAALAAEGIRAFVATPRHALNPHGQPMAMTATSLQARIKALLCNPEVDALLVVQ